MAPSADERDVASSTPPVDTGSRYKSPLGRAWAYFIAWLFEKPASTFTAWIIAILAIFAAAALSAVVGSIIKPLGVSNTVPGYVFLIIGATCLGAGLLIAWALTRAYYQLVIDKLKAEQEATVARLSQAHESKLDSSRKIVKSLTLYAEHIYMLLDMLGAGSSFLDDLGSEEAIEAVCNMPQAFLSAVTGQEYAVSIWREPTSHRRRDRISDIVSERMPSSLSERLPGRKFELVATPHHTPTECELFSIRVEPSWLKHHQMVEASGDSEASNGHKPRQNQNIDVARLVYRAEYPYENLVEDDIKAFEGNHYMSVCAVSLRREDDNSIGYLVALSKGPKAFTEIEERYMLWLKRIIEMVSRDPSEAGEALPAE